MYALDLTYINVCPTYQIDYIFYKMTILKLHLHLVNFKFHNQFCNGGLNLVFIFDTKYKIRTLQIFRNFTIIWRPTL